MRNITPRYYEKRWETITYLDGKRRAIEAAARKVLSGRERYEAVERETGAPWPVIGAIHSLEAGGDWRACLHNGQPWNRRTTLAPAGRGPWVSWEAAAADALRLKRRFWPRRWTIGRACRLLERYNGLGYAARGKDSPYLFAFSNYGVGVGKYVSDGRYDPNAVSRQCGAAVILKRLAEMGAFEPEFESAASRVEPLVRYEPLLATEGARRHQRHLNALGSMAGSEPFAPLAIDGRAGKKTSDAHRRIFGRWLWGDPRGGRTAAGSASNAGV